MNIPKDFKSNAAYLHITSWAGYCAGAIHAYGSIDFQDTKYELTRKISKEEADLLNKKDGYGATYRKGTTTSRFNDYDHVTKEAKSFFKRILRPLGAIYLIKGHNTASPNPIILAPSLSDPTIKLINKLTKQYDALYEPNRFSPKNEKEEDRLWKEWIKLTNKLGITNFHNY